VEYNLLGCDRDGLIYFKTCQGSYGLPQAGILANNLFDPALLPRATIKLPPRWGFGATNSILSNSAPSSMIFGVKNIGLEYFNHFLVLLKNYLSVQVNMAGEKLVGMDIKWDCASKHY
jgi:hypothetical protein